MRLQSVLQHLSLGTVTRYENLTLAPILGSDAVSEDFLLPDEAIPTGYFIVRESGRIETLQVENRLGVPVFIPAGSTFEGETQNRAARYAAIVAPRSGPLPLLVRCIEQGQPLVASKRFLGSEGILVPSARTGDVPQDTVWGSISHTVGRTPTSDYTAGLRVTDVERYLAAAGPPAPGQRGYVAAIAERGGYAFYADVLGNRRLYARLHERLWRGVAAVARAAAVGLRPSTKGAGIGKGDLLGFLREAGQLDLETRPLRRGFSGTVCIGSGSLEVSALVDSGIAVQASFRKEPLRPPPSPSELTFFGGMPS